jgi:hypothetical protein
MKEVHLEKYVDSSTIEEARLITPERVNLMKMVNPVSARILNIQRKTSLDSAPLHLGGTSTWCVQTTNISLKAVEHEPQAASN